MINSKYIFSSQRLGFRPYKVEDLTNLVLLDGNINVRSFFPNGALSTTQIKANMDQLIDFYNKNSFGFYIVESLDNQEFLGRCGFGPGSNSDEEIEVGYVFLEKFWGIGYATEALNKTLEFADLNLPKDKKIVAWTTPNHLASRRVLEKCGFKFVRQEIKNNLCFVLYQK